VLQAIEAAEAVELLAHLSAQPGLAASARLETAEIRIPQRPLDAQIPQAVAVGAVRIAGVAGGRLSGR